MERVCFLLQVRPERLDEYKREHAAVWPRDAGGAARNRLAELLTFPA